MPHPEEELIGILKEAGVDFISSLPCEKIKLLLEMIETVYGRAPLHHVPLTREEEGVGISAGAALAGRRPAMFVQSSGVGNMINALLSLTGFYELPLSVFVSQRGIYKEKIEAQVPMGQRLPGILKGAGIPYSLIGKRDDFGAIGKSLSDVYENNKMHVFLMSPAIWEKSEAGGATAKTALPHPSLIRGEFEGGVFLSALRRPTPGLTRFEILEIIAPYLDSKAVVCNLGFPSKELFHIKHRQSNFYMLGSMGMTIPIGLGISLTSEKDVIVIDGDGSILMNPGSLATTAHFAPENLTLIAIDNSSYGSTGNQPTLTGSCVDLEVVAKGFGIKNTCKAATKRQLIEAMEDPSGGLKFIHAPAVAGNRDVPAISLRHLDNKKEFQNFLRKT